MNVLTSYMSKIMKSTNMIGDSSSNKQSSIVSSDHEKTGSQSGTQSVPPPSGSLAAFSADDATIIKEKLGNLYSAIQEVNEERSGSETTLAGIARTHEKIQQEPSKPQLKSSLRRLYNKALQDCESEVESLQKCLDIIAEIRKTVRNRPRKGGLFNKETSIRRGALMKMLQSSAQTMPLFIPRGHGTSLHRPFVDASQQSRMRLSLQVTWLLPLSNLPRQVMPQLLQMRVTGS